MANSDQNKWELLTWPNLQTGGWLGPENSKCTSLSS